jgi:hypothetical protein
VREESFTTSRPLFLDIRLPRGDVEIATVDGDEATVTLDGGKRIDDVVVRLDERGDHDVLLVDADIDDFGISGRRFSFSLRFDRPEEIDVQVTVPHGTSLRTTCGVGDVHAVGRYSEVEARSASGDIAVADVERDARVNVASGDVEVERVGGSLQVKTAAGDLRAGRVAGRAEVRTASGDVALDEVGGGVTVQTASGDLRVASVGEGPVELKSVSGDMLVGIRRGSRVWLDVKSVTGDATSELDAGGEDEDGPLVELKATAISGDIKIVRA